MGLRGLFQGELYLYPIIWTHYVYVSKDVNIMLISVQWNQRDAIFIHFIKN
jgi:hypothetical protein